MRYAIGDIHGRYTELVKLLEQVNFNYEEDLLISLGDVVDRGPEPFKCIFELLKIKNLIAIRGNHDVCLQLAIKQGYHLLNGEHGSRKTIELWPTLIPEEKLIVKKFLESQVNYYIDEDNNLFLHAGLDIQYEIQDQVLDTYYWDRDFFESLIDNQELSHVETIENFKEIFIGHTPSICFFKEDGKYIEASKGDNKKLETYPIHLANVWNLDTGAGFNSGMLSIINLETKEIFQEKII